MATSTRPPEPLLTAVLLGLSAVTGIVDATSYLALGHVFTANMTGNIALLGFALARAQGLSVPRSGAALLAFLLGALLGGRMATRMRDVPRHFWTGSAFAAEASLYLAATGAALGQVSGLWGGSAVVYAVIILTGLAMGIRNATVRKLGVSDLTTTVLTLTLAALAADSAWAGGSNPAWSRRLASVLALILGAAMGTWLLGASLTWPLAVCAGISGACAFSCYFGLAGRPMEPAEARE
jgi:uncharacterized membrane protein YoaK (UPF0700 family)